MNLILTDKCTNSCPYCFAALEMQRNQKTNSLTRENFEIFMSYVERESTPIHLSVIGGEPLIYKDLDYLLHRLYDSPKIASFTIFTGGIVSSTVIQSLAPYRNKTSILFNVNEKESYRNPHHFDTVVGNIEQAILSGISCNIGFNIYHHGFNGSQIIELCHAYGIEILRFSVACPIYGKPSPYVVPPEEYDKLGREVFAFLMDCHKAGIKAMLDCPVPLCFFTDKELGVLTRLQPGVASRLNHCHPPLDINYNLKVFRCFSLSNYSDVYLTDFDSFEKISNHFSEKIDLHLQRPTVFAKCETCDSTARCSGGCLSNNGLFLELPTKKDRINDVFALMHSGQVEKAIDNLKKINNRSIPEFMLEAELWLYLSNPEEARPLLFRCANEACSDEIRFKAINLLKSL